MRKQVVFIQGAGDGAYDADAKLAASLRQALGDGYEVRYPAMPNEGDASYVDLARWLDAELSGPVGPVILVGHSVGGAVVLKWLSDNPTRHPIDSVFILAVPFWGGAGWRSPAISIGKLMGEPWRNLCYSRFCKLVTFPKCGGWRWQG